MDVLRKSITAGVLIGIGASIYLSLENHIIGALLFTIGLFMICSYEMFLFTGKIGYLEPYKKSIVNCTIIWIGNLIGSIIVSTIVRIARPDLHNIALTMVDNKLNINPVSVALSAFMCGILMYLAVENFRRNKNTFSGIIGLFLCVTVFILCGFEHSIADMNYLVFSIQTIKEIPKYLLFIILVSMFNGFGAKFIRCLTKE